MLVLPCCNLDDPCLFGCYFSYSPECRGKSLSTERGDVCLLRVSTVADRAIRHFCQRLTLGAVSLRAAAYSSLFASVFPSSSTLFEISEKDKLGARYLASAPIHIQTARLILLFLFFFLFRHFSRRPTKPGRSLSRNRSFPSSRPTPFLPFSCRTFRPSHFFPPFFPHLK